ncbi:MAG: response regulator transcription factor [Gemmatimonadetes bacterium]|nr:response regulator transcription factor [Gemmatimonadota bacterium]
MDRLRTLIVDDEPPARAKVARILTTRDDVEVVGEAADGLEAVERIRALRPDLVILDIQMPGRTGFDVLASLESDMPYVVFATAYDEHAIRAFEVAAVDYLLKPFNRDRLFTAIDRVQARRESEGKGPQAALERLLALLDSATPGELKGHLEYVERLVVESRGRRILVDVDDVRSLRADGNYVAVHVEGRSYLCRGTLTSYADKLDPRRFIRVHRSVLVNLDRVRELKPIARGDQLLILDDGSEVRMSRHYRDALSRLLDP